jgi:flagellar protein FlaJ
MLEKIQLPNYLKNIILTGKAPQFIVNVATIVCATVFILMTFLTSLGIVETFFTPVDFIVLTILSITGIYGWFTYLHVRKIYKIDSIFPDFVRDLAESRRAGMTFTKAVLFASKGNYGILTPEIQKISQQVSWGSSVTDALFSFAERVNTKSIKRTVSLIIEASKSGGNVADVIDVAAKDAREIKMLEAERKSNMASYIVVIYVGAFVFLAIIAILVVSFLPSMTGSSTGGLQGAMGGGSVRMEDIQPIFYYATIVQGIGSGLVAGVFEDGNFSSSVKHVFILVLASWLTFKILL